MTVNQREIGAIEIIDSDTTPFREVDKGGSHDGTGRNNVVYPTGFHLMDRLRQVTFERRIGSRYPLEAAKAALGRRRLYPNERSLIENIVDTDWRHAVRDITNPHDIEFAARGISLGAVVCGTFANMYSVQAHPTKESVIYVNRSKGRPDNQVGSITTTKERMERIFDWSQLPRELSKNTALDIMDAFFKMGSFGFRGPAADIIPDHLTALDGDRITTQIIAPGYRCPSNAFIAMVLELTGLDYVFITSANISHHITGNNEEPAHYQIRGIQKDFGGKPGFIMLAYPDEVGIRESYPKHLQNSTSILALHKITYDHDNKPILYLERHGSLHHKEIEEIVCRFGFGLTLGPRAQSRLPVRNYTN